MSTRFLEKLCRRAFGGESRVRVLQKQEADCITSQENVDQESDTSYE